MNADVLRTVRRLVDPLALDHDDSGPVTVAPTTEEECAVILRTASLRGWTTAFTGLGNWSPRDRPADIVLSTRRLNQIVEVRPDDLFATVEAGVPMATLRERLRASDTWIPIDEPGTDRSIGSIVSTGTAGPLQSHFGPVRDQILGMTVVTPMGNTITAGGRLVKNVAGFDLPKLMIGGFGAFGLITRLHLRVRVLPESDVTEVALDDLTRLQRAREELVAADISAASWEIRSLNRDHDSSPGWSLAVRVMGTREAVERHLERLGQRVKLTWDRLTDAEAVDYRASGTAAHSGGPVTVRVGTQPTTLGATMSLLREAFGGGFTTVMSPPAMLRWSGKADAAAIRELRAKLAELTVPLTVERAPWSTLSSVGHFGAFRPGVAPLLASLGAGFDPKTILTAPIVGV